MYPCSPETGLNKVAPTPCTELRPQHQAPLFRNQALPRDSQTSLMTRLYTASDQGTSATAAALATSAFFMLSRPCVRAARGCSRLRAHGQVTVMKVLMYEASAVATPVLPCSKPSSLSSHP